MKLKLILLTFFGICWNECGLYAQHVTEEQALQKAQAFMQNKVMASNGSRHNAPRKMKKLAKAAENDAYYVFNAEDNGGFVIVSSDERTEEILGYSSEGNIDPNNMPENMQAWLKGYEEQILAIPVGAKATPAKVPTHSAVDPLISAKWSQGSPYNLQCPTETPEGGTELQHCVTGCVATAMAQIMYYYKWPQNYTTSIPAYDSGWVNQTGTYKFHEDELPPIMFDWANMKDTYSGSETDASADAVAQLMHYCGQSLYMNYGIEGSGAMTVGIVYALYHYFNYSKTIREIEQADFTPEGWNAVIYNEIYNHRPVVFNGGSYTSRHAFVCDGYDGLGMYHINWGWGGSCDGFFRLSVLNPYNNSYNTGYDSFSLYWGSAVIGIQEPSNNEEITPDMIIQPRLDRMGYPDQSVRLNFRGNNNSNLSFFIDTAIGIVNPNDNSIESIYTIQENVSVPSLILYSSNSCWRSVFLEIPEGDYFKEDVIYRILPLYKKHGSQTWVTGPGDMPSYYNVKYSNGVIEFLSEPLRQAHLEITKVEYAGSSGNKLFYDVTFKNNGESLWCQLRYNFMDVNETLQSFTDEPHWRSLTELSIQSGGTETVRFIFDYDGSNSGDYKLAIVLNDTYNRIGSNHSWGYGYPIIYQGIINVSPPISLIMSQPVINFDADNISITVTNNDNVSYDHEVAVRLFGRETDYLDKNKGILYKSEKLHIEPGESVEVEIPCPGIDIDKLYYVKLQLCKNPNSDALSDYDTGLYFVKPKTVSQFTVDGVRYRVVDSRHRYVFANQCTNEVAEDLIIPSTVVSPTDGNIYIVKGIDQDFTRYQNVKSVSLSEGITTIEQFSFNRSANLTTITLPASLNQIRAWTIIQCPNLKSIYMKNVNPPLIVQEGKSNNLICEDMYSNVMLYVPDGSKAMYEASACWNRFTNILELESLSNIEFADANVKAICLDNWDTNNNGELSYAEAAAVTDLGEVFKGNKTITSFNELKYFTGLTSINKMAFYNCTSLTSIIIPCSVTSIGDGAFYKCDGLINLTTPNSLTSIGKKAFDECFCLASITIPNGVTSIGDYAFSNCYFLASNFINNSSLTSSDAWGATLCDIETSDGLLITDNSVIKCRLWATSVTIPNTVTSISGWAFSGCTGLTSVIIPNTVKSIGGKSFFKCGGLTSITIPNSVTSIGTGAFEACSGLTSVIIPNSVTTIGQSAFSDCTGLTSITIGNGVTNIGETAFSGCTGLTSITIPNSVTSIGNYVFAGCNNLASVIISNSVTSIGYWAFLNCSALSSVISEIEEPFAFSNGAFSNISDDCVLTVPYGTRDAYIAAGWTEDVFKGGVVEPSPTINFADANVKALCIANWDTNGDGELSEVEAAAVTDLGEVFKSNQTITSFDELQYFTELASIGNGAFLNCTHLTSVNIPNNVTSINNYAFKGCTGLTSITIPNSVTSIGDNAFLECSLTSITIPSSVNSISEWAFYGCRSLTSITVETGNETYLSKDGVLFNKAGTTLIAYPVSKTGAPYTISNSITSIGNNAFLDCKGLTSVIIPNSVNSIGANAFYQCGLTSVIIPNGVTSIRYDTFCNCQNLTSVTIGNSVTSIGGEAFRYCTSLSSINIPNSVTTIGEYAFSSCIGLTSITISKSLTFIGESAFTWCTGLTSITIPSSVTKIGDYAFDGCNSLSSVISEIEEPFVFGCSAFDNISDNCVLTVPAGTRDAYIAAGWTEDVFKGGIVEEQSSPIIQFADSNVKAICVTNWDTDGDGELSEAEAAAVTDLGEVFKGNKTITSFNELQYFKGLTGINELAFSGCTNLTSVIIPIGVTSIEKCAFFNCTSLNSVIIPNSVISIGSQAFDYCYSLTSIVIPSSVTSIDSFMSMVCNLTSIVVDSHNPIFDSRDNCNAIIKTSTNTLIRGCNNTIIPNGITRIGDSAFRDCSGLKSITIPNSVTSIGWDSFYGCSGLTSLIIPKSVTSIGEFTFKSCWGLTSIVVDGDNPIYDSRDNCNAIIETSTNTLIRGCNNTIIPQNIKSIGRSAFNYCSGLATLTIPNSVTSIRSEAFYGCSGLITITISESVANIEDFAFRECTSLTSITIPNNVTSIGDYAFEGCRSLTYVKVDNKTPVNLYDNTFSNSRNCILCVPVGCKASYSSAAYWNSFRKIIEFHEGDVNADEKTNVLDVVDIARFVVKTPSDSFVEIIADINRDGSVNLSDAVVLVNEIAGDQNFARAMFVPENEIINDALLLKGVNGNYSLSMNNERQYTAFQFDLYVPEDLEISNVMLNEQRKHGHQLLYNKVENGHYCIAALSISNNVFNGVDGELLNIAVNGVAGNEVNICNIHFFDVYGNDYQFNDINGSTTTDMNSLPHAFSKGGKAIYDLQGRKREKLQRGVNIVNGKKILY